MPSLLLISHSSFLFAFNIFFVDKLWRYSISWII